MAAMKQHNKLHLYTILTVYFFLSCSSFNTNPNINGSDLATLLAFKAIVDTSNVLSSWSNSTNSSNDPCTTWIGVTCHPITHRVNKLVLNHLNLTGSIETLAQLTHLRLLSLHHNQFSSAPNFSSWPNLKHLYLSHNRFSGKFPAGISRTHRLHRLDLSYNNFSGEIPMNELTQLPYLLTLRLEFNSFAGKLDHVHKPWPSLQLLDFNISNNNLTGKIPDEISMFLASSFAGNAHLCGKPLPFKCLNQPAKGVYIDNTRVSNQNKKSLKYKMVVMFIILDVVAVLLTLVTITWCCYKKKYNKNNERKNKMKKNNDYKYKVYGNNIVRESLNNNNNEEMVYFEGCKGFVKVDELLKASAEMLGKGGVGTTYKVVVDGGDVVVVKRVREKLRKMKEVHGFLKEIGGLRHLNVVSLRAYYSSKDELLLVYDFLQNGSLHNILHGNRGPGRTPLNWTTRLKLAKESATGLSFLHNHNKSKLIHGHITSSNILINHQGNACISDIGLHQLLQQPSFTNNIPNDQNTNIMSSQKTDVYSFGVVLLELLTGKIETDEGENSLVKWVQRVVNKEWKWDVFDFELSSYKEMEDEMMALLQVAMLCVASLPKDRPKMSIVCKMIEDISIKSGRKNGKEFQIDDFSSDSSPSLVENTPNC